MTQQEFADFLQQAPATLSSIFNGRTHPTLKIVDAIKKKIPDISIEWLLYGVGDMHVTLPQPSSDDNFKSRNDVLEPMINFDSSSNSPTPVPQIQVQTTPVQQSVNNTHLESGQDKIKIFDKIARKVTEIRVYYDDQTYETFVPAKK